jgi:hypothetical protein
LNNGRLSISTNVLASVAIETMSHINQMLQERRNIQTSQLLSRLL